jgi:hypothetical protein
MNRTYGRWIVAGLVTIAFASHVWAQEQLVQIYVVRHPETESAPADPNAIHLSDTGRKRAALLVPAFGGIRITNLLASHTVRTRETLEDLARDRLLPIVQLPRPGSTWKGQLVTDQLSRREPIEPIADALLALRPGSIAVVGLNSENIFAVLNRLGVPVSTDGKTCGVGELCVPCLNNSCFPAVFDRLWYLALRPGKAEPVVFLELRYGTGWSPEKP